MDYLLFINGITPWDGMKEMKLLIDKKGINKKLLELGLPEGKSNNSIDAINIVEWLTKKAVSYLKI